LILFRGRIDTRTAEAEVYQGSREGQDAANSGVGAPRLERGGVCRCGRVHARRGTTDREGWSRVQHAARGRPDDSDEESTVGKGCTMNDVR